MCSTWSGTRTEAGEFRKGVLAYGYFAEHHPAEPPFPAGAWPAGTRIDTTTFTDEDDKTR